MLSSTMSIASVARLETTAAAIPPIPAFLGTGYELKSVPTLCGLPSKRSFYNGVTARTMVEAFCNASGLSDAFRTTADTILAYAGCEVGLPHTLFHRWLFSLLNL